jgi:hypothetical protein
MRVVCRIDINNQADMAICGNLDGFTKGTTRRGWSALLFGTPRKTGLTAQLRFSRSIGMTDLIGTSSSARVRD